LNLFFRNKFPCPLVSQNVKSRLRTVAIWHREKAPDGSDDMPGTLTSLAVDYTTAGITQNNSTKGIASKHP
jgi:hypothetical protein